MDVVLKDIDYCRGVFGNPKMQDMCERFATKDMFQREEITSFFSHVFDELQAWICVMFQADRLPYIEGALAVCVALLQKGVEDVVVTTAQPISQKTKKIVEKIAAGYLGKVRHIQYKEDPNIFAGVCIRKGWKQINLSLHECLLQAYQEIMLMKND